MLVDNLLARLYIVGSELMKFRTAAFFDLDKTIIATSSTAAFSRPFIDGGLIAPAMILRSAYAHFFYLVSGADENQTERMRAQLSQMVTGWPVAQVSKIVSETLHKYIDPYIFREALELIAWHKAMGNDIVIVSASGSELVDPIAAMLGADHAISTRMEVVDGKYTGGIDFYAYGENKASAIRELAVERGYDLARCFAYSDSITDVPLLESVGYSFVVNPDRALRKVATEKGWKVLSFTKPVPLSKALGVSKPIMATVVVGALVVGGLVVYRLVRRRRLKG